MNIKHCCQTQKKQSLLPLYILLGSIILLSLSVSFLFPSTSGMMNLMGIWFLGFGILKLPDLPGFVVSFSQYDFIAKRWRWYGYIYPFIEIILGLIYIFNTKMIFMLEINIFALIISIVGFLSACNVLRSGKNILCACMGTFWKLPITKVTILENGAMSLMLGFMLIYPSSMMDMRDEDLIKAHCKIMPEMSGCEKYSNSSGEFPFFL